VGARFFAHVQTGPGAHLASCTMGTGSSPGESGRGVVLTTHLLLAPRSGKSRAIPLPHSGPSSLLRCTFTFTFYLYRFRKYVSYGFRVINFCNPGVHYETPCIWCSIFSMKLYRCRASHLLPLGWKGLIPGTCMVHSTALLDWHGVL
jgi:hypothetical protein